MSEVGKRLLTWQGGEDEFCLAAVGDVLALEEKCGCGIGMVFNRLVSGTFYLNDIREPIRLGLVGAGMSPEKAMVKVKAHVDNNPRGLAPSIVVATAIVEAVIVGVPDDQVGKKQAADAETAPVSSTTTGASAAPQSSELEPA